MKKYYTRACNFFYGSHSKKLVRNKSTLPLCGDSSISFNQIEIFIKEKKKIRSKIISQFKNKNKYQILENYWKKRKKECEKNLSKFC